jgi:biotin operon repressor
VTQSQLAELTGLSRKTVNAHLRALEDEGILARDYRAIVVKDRARLRARAAA